MAARDFAKIPWATGPFDPQQSKPGIITDGSFNNDDLEMWDDEEVIDGQSYTHYYDHLEEIQPNGVLKWSMPCIRHNGPVQDTLALSREPVHLEYQDTSTQPHRSLPRMHEENQTGDYTRYVSHDQYRARNQVDWGNTINNHSTVSSQQYTSPMQDEQLGSRERFAESQYQRDPPAYTKHTTKEPNLGSIQARLWTSNTAAGSSRQPTFEKLNTTNAKPTEADKLPSFEQ
jgi:hypothetical protein